MAVEHRIDNASWARWAWLHQRLHGVHPLRLRMWLRLHVHLRIVQADGAICRQLAKRVQGGSPGEQA